LLAELLVNRLSCAWQRVAAAFGFFDSYTPSSPVSNHSVCFPRPARNPKKYLCANFAPSLLISRKLPLTDPKFPRKLCLDNLETSEFAPTTTAMVDFITRSVGWKTDARYEALSSDVNRQWDRNDDLRAVAADPKLRVLIEHGWNDLSCPFMGRYSA
jgi:hypothetical protein